MDGFSPTYKHVMAGCSQGNNAWMLRDFADLRELQVRVARRTHVRGEVAPCGLRSSMVSDGTRRKRSRSV